MKNTLLDELCVFLLKQGYLVKTLARNCFDVIARKDSEILLVKAIDDPNSLAQEAIDAMKTVSGFFHGTPFIVATHRKFIDSVVYMRNGVWTVSRKTFEDCVQQKFPIVKSSHAGLTMKLKGDTLKALREKQGISVNQLARKIGVSARMTARYEKEGAEITANKAKRLYGLFGSSVFEVLNVFEAVVEAEVHQSPVTRKYAELGFNSTVTEKVPFNVVAKKEKELILTNVGDKLHKDTAVLAKLIDADSLTIFNRKKPKEIPAMTQKEFFRLDEADELLEFLKEFK